MPPRAPVDPRQRPPPTLVADGPDHVRVGAPDGRTCRVPRATAVRLFLASHRSSCEATGALAVAVLTPGLTPGAVPPAYVWFGPAGEAPPWPTAALGEAAAAGVRGPLPLPTPGRWVALPDPEAPSAALDALVARALRERQVRAQRIGSEIEERCQSVVGHGEDGAFTQSLDYYTTVRVKAAFQRMNREGLERRRDEVRACLRATLAVCRRCPEAVAAAYTPPTEGEGPGPSEPDGNPNALCVPGPEDYSLDEPAGP